MKTARTLSQVVLTLSAVVLCGGCTVQTDPEGDPETGTTSWLVDKANSAFLNGIGENGIGENGIGENGIGENGIGENGIGENGIGENGSLLGYSFNVSKISGGKINGVKLNALITKALVAQTLMKNSPIPQGFMGMEVTGKLGSGDEVTLRLDGSESFTSFADKKVYRYTISVTQPGSNVRAYVCGKKDGVPVKTIAVTGRWDYRQGVEGGGSKISDPNSITFACEGYALYKCVDLGYHPWAKNSKKDKKKASPEEYHQACTRMIRADYCGDGQPWTIDGTIINIYDNIGIQKDEESWPIEAEWNTEGARCLSHQRIQNMSEVPQCSFERTAVKCGNPPEWSKTLLVSEAK